jgi:NTP pyrophosphatase (non-canonical NTP hydrolase)
MLELEIPKVKRKWRRKMNRDLDNAVCPDCGHYNTMGEYSIPCLVNKRLCTIFCEACGWTGVVGDIKRWVGEEVGDNLIHIYQLEVQEWARKHFNPDSKNCLLGLVEEVGELAHSVLKLDQKIRTDEDHKAKIIDAVGDIFVYLMDFCNCRGIRADKAIDSTWNKVKKRDWSKDKTGAGK